MLKKQIEEKLERVNLLETMLAETQAEIDENHQWVAEVTCPYDIGDVLVTDRGIGTNGLVVSGIVVPQFPRDGNRWSIVGTAYSKSGELTKRTVTITEFEASSYNLRKKEES